MMKSCTSRNARCLLLFLGILCCCFSPRAAAAAAAAVLDCPATRIKFEDLSSPTVIDFQRNSSYELGPGVFVLNNAVAVQRDSVLW
jgi:hypothetical protein